MLVSTILFYFLMYLIIFPIISHNTKEKKKTLRLEEKLLQAARLVGEHAVRPARTRTERTVRIHAALLSTRLETLIHGIETAVRELSKAATSTETVRSAASRKLY